MSTALRFPMPHERDPDALTAHIEHLEQQLDDALAEARRLRGALAASMLRYSGHTTKVIDGVLHIIQHNGTMHRYEKVVIDDAANYGEKWAFVKCPPVPGSPAAFVDSVQAERPADMGVTDGEPVEIRS